MYITEGYRKRKKEKYILEVKGEGEKKFREVQYWSKELGELHVIVHTSKNKNQQLSNITDRQPKNV